MATGPQTKVMLQAAQWTAFSEFLVNGVSPFTAWKTDPNSQNPNSVSDLARYGANPNGSVTTAVYLGWPKEPTTIYPRQCQVVPPPHEQVSRGAYSGHVFHETWVYVKCMYLNVTDWYQDQQDLIDLADVVHTVLQKHAQLPNAPTVTAAKEAAAVANMPIGFFKELYAGREWACWGFVWWLKQDYTLPSGFVQ